MTILELVPEHRSDTQSPFDAIKQINSDGSEFWSARALMKLMGYSAWRNFGVPLERAIRAAINQNIDVTSHFAESRKMVERAQGGGVSQEDYHLSRFAAYLVTMNGDPNKAEVAAAQGYFAKQTRFAELVQENPALVAAATDVQTALTAREVGTFYFRTLDAYAATITSSTAESSTAHALAYSMQEFARMMARMVENEGILTTAQDIAQNALVPAPVFAMDAPAGIPAPSPVRSGDANTESSQLPDFDFLQEGESQELITWAEFAKRKGLRRCGPCAQGLSNRVMHAATACGTSRGRHGGHNMFTLRVWETAWEACEDRYTTMHNDPARNHVRGRA